MTAQQSKTLDFAFHIMGDGESYSDISTEEIATLQELAQSEGLKEADGDSVYPPAEQVWDIGLYAICIYKKGNTKLISVIA